jgi:hypothetical protein
VKLGKLQSLLELDLSECSEFECLPNSIVNLSQLETFCLRGCHKSENLLVKLGKRESLVELDLSECFELGCLLYSIMNLSNLQTFQSDKCRNRKICKWNSKNFKAWWNWTYLVAPSWGVYSIQLWTCHNSRHFNCEGATNWRIYQ